MKNGVRDLVDQWLAKADSDRHAINILIQKRRAPNDTICFHCQQYVEKLLKGYLTLEGIEFPKTHDLRTLSEAALIKCPELFQLLLECDSLTKFAVDSRYPDNWEKTSRKHSLKMMKLAEKFAAILLPKIKNRA